jgi:2-dehydropantoate 2-reductase
MKFAIYGSGGVGGYFGGRLAQAGEDVTFVARGEHLKAIKQNGLRVESIAGDFGIHPARATDQPAEAGAMDCVIVAVKAWDVPSAAGQMKPLIGPRTVVIPLENGVDAPDQLSAALGGEHILGGLCRLSAFIGAPGVIRHVGIAPFIAFGELDARPSDRVEALRAIFARCQGLNVDVPADVNVAMWEKFIFIASISGVGAVTRQPAGGFRNVPEARALLIQSIAETAAVARARGVPLTDDTSSRILATIDNMPPATFASMQRDIMDGRPSELESQNGAVVRMGRGVNIPTPAHEFIYASLLPGELQARR